MNKNTAKSESFTKLNVLILNASLKHKGELSNTEELARLVVKNMKAEHNELTAEFIRLSDLYIPPGLKFSEDKKDKWPEIARKIVASDIIIFATPIWWGARSSLMQRIIERMDSFDEQYKEKGRSVLMNKVAGVVITGSEDGAQSTLGSLLSVLTFMNFTIPPECCTYWVGEVGKPPANNRRDRLKNKSSKVMAQKMASNLVYYANLLKKYPLVKS
ncbi:MAG TPA: NAD(P)H-dependent oxidoreductase [Ignavibacteria bacterium]|nr:NAD(P)H-dependent oxidoreductase [Ignavibacteria bacterium]HRF65565.1 NAD(P)H-dependent oxidoreductase [Ignavibacteria bacterium]HRJ02939.1 NAD(P)H-dependent oxidoreductase [Ignavibacteria bacterium]